MSPQQKRALSRGFQHLNNPGHASLLGLSSQRAPASSIVPSTLYLCSTRLQLSLWHCNWPLCPVPESNAQSACLPGSSLLPIFLFHIQSQKLYTWVLLNSVLTYVPCPNSNPTTNPDYAGLEGRPQKTGPSLIFDWSWNSILEYTRYFERTTKEWALLQRTLR